MLTIVTGTICTMLVTHSGFPCRTSYAIGLLIGSYPCSRNSFDMFSDTKQFVAHESNAVGSTMPPMHVLLTSMFSRSFVIETRAVTTSEAMLGELSTVSFAPSTLS